MTNENRLDRLTPRERDVYEGAMVEDPLERLSPKMLAVHELDLQGLAPAEIGRRMRLSELAVRNFLEVIDERLNPPPETDAGRASRDDRN